MKFPARPSLCFFTVSFVFLSTFLLPQVGRAATMQASLDRAVKELVGRQALRINGDLDVRTVERVLGSKTETEISHVRLFLNQSVASGTTGVLQSEGKVALQSLDIKALEIALKNPASFEWKHVDGSTYVRLASASPELWAWLNAESTTMSALVGTWYRIPSHQADIVNTLPIAGLNTPNSSFFSPNILTALKSTNVLQVLRLETRETRSDGHILARLRVRLNPRMITILQQEALRLIDAKDPLRASKRRETVKQFTVLRSTLSRVAAVAVIDETAGTLERLEFGMKQILPKQACVWNDALKRDVCQSLRQTATTAAGISFFKEPSNVIAAPAAFSELEELFSQLRTSQTPPEESANPVEALSTP